MELARLCRNGLKEEQEEGEFNAFSEFKPMALDAAANDLSIVAWPFRSDF